MASFHPSNSASQVAFAVKNSSQKGVSDPKQKQGKKDRPLCSHCGVLGHSVDKCFKLHGYPPNYGKGKGKPQAVHLVSEESPISSTGDSSLMLTQSQYQHLLSMLSTQVLQPTAHSDQRDSGSVGKVYSASHSTSQITSIQWILDIGASSHIACSSSLFSDLTSHSPSFVSLPNNTRVLVHAVGTVTLSDSLTLRDVLYIPDFHVNLISIPALLKHSSILAKFTADSCYLQDSNSLREIGKGELDAGLYVLRQGFPASSIADLNKVYATHHVSLDTWHARLGHLSDKILNKLRSVLQFSGSSMSDCTVCPLAKLRRLSFVSNNHMSKNPFDLVHCDVWGPYHTPTYNGMRYFLTIVDDCTRFTWVYLLHNKSEATNHLVQFFTLIETQFGKTIKQVRSDNAKELALTQFLQKKGVLH